LAPLAPGLCPAGNRDRFPAVIIGIVFLKERVNLARLASIALTLVGTALLKLSR